MEFETKPSGNANWFSTLLMAAAIVAMLLTVRQFFVGWLLPDGRFLEALAQRVQKEPVAEAVFSGVQDWFVHE